LVAVINANKLVFQSREGCTLPGGGAAIVSTVVPGLPFEPVATGVCVVPLKANKNIKEKIKSFYKGTVGLLKVNKYKKISIISTFVCIYFQQTEKRPECKKGLNLNHSCRRIKCNTAQKLNTLAIGRAFLKQ
jgi:hypothetical protein